MAEMRYTTPHVHLNVIKVHSNGSVYTLYPTFIVRFSSEAWMLTSSAEPIAPPVPHNPTNDM